MRKIKLLIGVLMIICSFVLISIGFYINIKTPDKSFNNQTNSHDLDDVIISTEDGENPKTGGDSDDKKPEEQTPETPTTPETPGGDFGGDSGGGDSGGDSGGSSGGGQSTPEIPYTPPEPDPPYVPPTPDPTPNPPAESNITSQVESLRTSIANNYGVYAFYGNDVADYSVGGYGVIPCTDMNTIYNALVELQYCVSLYPTGFFREMSNNGLALNIYLIQRYTAANITGITERVYGGCIISIALDYPFGDTFHHENFHYMEHFINFKGGYFSNWNRFNPSGFNYGSYNDAYVWEYTYSEDAFFVNSYSQSYEYEDRASTFEYMMANSKINALNVGRNIWMKANEMANTIDYYFSTVNSSTVEYWERFLS